MSLEKSPTPELPLSGVKKPRQRRNSRRAGEAAIPADDPGIALRSIDGHVVRTDESMYAWYRLAPQRWPFRTDESRESLIQAVAGIYAEMPGRWCHLRVTDRPYPAKDWRDTHEQNATDRPPDVPGALSYAKYLDGDMGKLSDQHTSEKEVYLGVEIRSRTLSDRAMEKGAPLIRRVAPSLVDIELGSQRDEIAHVDDLMARRGHSARPVTVEEMRWLLLRSTHLGLPGANPDALPAHPDAVWGRSDLHAVTDGVRWTQPMPYDTTLFIEGRTASRHVAVLSLGLCSPLRIPEVDPPFLKKLDGLDFAVETSARIYVRRPEHVEAEMRRQAGKIHSQTHHHLIEHGETPPQALARQAEQVAQIEDEMTTGFTAGATRVRSYWRLAVSAPDKRSAISRAGDIAECYKPKIAIEHPEAQYALAREFIPGEPLGSGAHERRASVMWVASAMPQATADVGDRHGILLGSTCTATRKPIMWNPWAAMEFRNNSGMCGILGDLGSGKALDLDTPLPTPTGWTMMGEVQVGDWLLGRDGNPTRVTAATGVMHGRLCYDVKFSDGSVIRADAEHQWSTRTTKDRVAAERLRRRFARHEARSSIPPQPVKPSRVLTVHTTEEIARTLTFGPNDQRNHSIPVAHPFVLPDVDLLIDPYVLGAWLGDGNTVSASITNPDPEVIAEIEKTGQECRPRKTKDHYGLVGTLQVRLRELGVLGDKHIPGLYLRASEEQRRALLAGLLDTDGYCTKGGSVELGLTRWQLAHDAWELVLSLGYKPNWRTKPCAGRLPETSTCYTISFTTSDKVFRLPRKAARLNPTNRPTNDYRYITAVIPVKSVPVRCVQVDNEDHIYLAGRTCIPTHNSVLGGTLVYKTVRDGASWTILDPSGPLARMVEIPELAPYVRVVNLLNGEPGILNPYRVVPEPRLEQFADEEDPERSFQRAIREAAATRKRLCLDILLQLLPYEISRMPQTRMVLLAAVKAAGGETTTTIWDVVDVLSEDPSEHADHARSVARFLEEMSDRISLLIPEEGKDPYSEERDYRVTVLTMPGLALPKEGASQEHWSDEERFGIALLNLAAWLTQRFVYDGDKDSRKGVWIDEAFFLSEVSTGRVLMNRFARDSRKWNVRVLFSSQVPEDFLRIPGFVPLLDAMFVGRLDDYAAQRDALRMLKAPIDVGYEETIASLGAKPDPNAVEPDNSPRNFVFADGTGGIEMITIDVSGEHLTGLRAALETTPGKKAEPFLGTAPVDLAKRPPELPIEEAPVEELIEAELEEVA